MYKMDNKTIHGVSFCDVYGAGLKLLIDSASYESSPRGLKVRECLNVQLVIEDPYQNLFDNSYRGIPEQYLKDELLLYFSGRHDAEGFTKASKFWDKIKTSQETINSAYGKLIFNTLDAQWESYDGLMSQWSWAKKSLINDDQTRQAIIHFNRPYHQYKSNKDFVCTMYGIFHIRDNKLNFSIFMRSQDIRKGTQFDIPFFTILQQEMLNELKLDGKFKDLKIGSYTHFCNSFHLYEPDFDIAKNMIEGTWTSKSTPKLDVNPIMHPDIIQLSYDKNYKYLGISSANDPFINWLKT